MRIFALELNNDLKGVEARKQYIESLIAKLPSPELVVLPELAICSYMANKEIWQYADDSNDTARWAVYIAEKYNIYIGVGYLAKENDDYYNRYMIAGKESVCGVVTKSEGESAVFRRGWFDNVIATPFGNVGVAICYDSKRRHFYDNVKDNELSLILFPHGCPADPRKPQEEMSNNDFFCEMYMNAFGVPVVYVNSKGKLEYMPGKMGLLMAKAGFMMNGRSKIYSKFGTGISTDLTEAFGMDVELAANRLKQNIRFYGNDLIKGNWFFRQFILKPDTKAGIKVYNRNCK